MAFISATTDSKINLRDNALNLSKKIDRSVMGGQSQTELYPGINKDVAGLLASLRNIEAAPNLQVKGNDVFFIGDSLTAYGVASSGGNNSGTMYTPLLCAQSWPAIAMGLTGGRLRYAGQAATGGYTSAQILSTHLPTAVTKAATYTVILCGRNDVRASTAAATSLANIASMCNQLVAVGSTPVLCSMAAQSGNSDAWETIRFQLNKLIREYANSKGYPFIDMDTPTRDGNGQWAAGYNLDVSHPSPAGAYVMAKTLANGLLKVLPNVMPIRPATNSGNSNKVTNGRFSSLTGWTTSGSPAVSGGAVSVPAGSSLTQTITTVSGTVYSLNFAFKVTGLSPNVALYIAEGSTLKAGIREWQLAGDTLYLTFEYTASATSSTITVSSTAGTLIASEVGLYPMA